MLEWQAGTPVLIPAVNGESSPMAFRGILGKFLPCMGAV